MSDLNRRVLTPENFLGDWEKVDRETKWRYLKYRMKKQGKAPKPMFPTGGFVTTFDAPESTQVKKHKKTKNEKENQ